MKRRHLAWTARAGILAVIASACSSTSSADVCATRRDHIVDAWAEVVVTEASEIGHEAATRASRAHAAARAASDASEASITAFSAVVEAMHSEAATGDMEIALILERVQLEMSVLEAQMASERAESHVASLDPSEPTVERALHHTLVARDTVRAAGQASIERASAEQTAFTLLHELEPVCAELNESIVSVPAARLTRQGRILQQRARELGTAVAALRATLGLNEAPGSSTLDEMNAAEAELDRLEVLLHDVRETGPMSATNIDSVRTRAPELVRRAEELTRDFGETCDEAVEP